MSRPAPPFARELDLLTHGALRIEGLVRASSNVTFVVEATKGRDAAWGVYKPEAGERPLWDFEAGLHARERAAFLLSESLGWHLVPPRVVRDDGPAGIGSVQWFIEHSGEHYFTLFEGDPDAHDQLRRLAVFDVIANNTDRKSGHVLRDADGHVWGIDHGLCFSAEPKLRTVVWDFAGEPIDDDLLADLAPLAESVSAELGDLLTEDELAALRERASRLLRVPFLPRRVSDFEYPWPLV